MPQTKRHLPAPVRIENHPIRVAKATIQVADPYRRGFAACCSLPAAMHAW